MYADPKLEPKERVWVFIMNGSIIHPGECNRTIALPWAQVCQSDNLMSCSYCLWSKPTSLLYWTSERFSGQDDRITCFKSGQSVPEPCCSNYLFLRWLTPPPSWSSNRYLEGNPAKNESVEKVPKAFGGKFISTRYHSRKAELICVWRNMAACSAG